MDYKINTKVYPRLKALELIEKAVEIDREIGSEIGGAMIDIITITTNAPIEGWALKVIEDNMNNKDITPYEAANNIYKEICAR